jgi:AraC-like DNA-binding protein
MPGVPRRIDISTEAVPEPQRFGFWRAALRAQTGILAEADRETAGAFLGGMSTVLAGSLQCQIFGMDGHRVLRDRTEVARRHFNGYWIHYEAGDGTWIDLGDGAEAVTNPGDMLIVDADIPLQAAPIRRWGQHLWLVPKPLLEPFLPKRAGPLLAQLSGQSGVNALAAAYLATLARHVDTLGDVPLGLATDHLCRLIGIACGAPAGEQPESVRRGRLAKAKRHIDRHLADPALSPATVAAALGISVRTLHSLFEPTGTTFFRHVQRRRIDECRQALLANPDRPVIDIAFAWGFGSLSGFYRAFHAAFAASPGEIRQAARRTGAAGPAL